MRSKRNRQVGTSRKSKFTSKAAISKKFALLSRGGYEVLESRSLLAADGLSFSDLTNRMNRFDVNGDGKVAPQDVLLIVNELNRISTRSLVASAQTNVVGPQTQQQLLSSTATSEDPNDANFYDVNGDGNVNPQDVLMVVAALNPNGPEVAFSVQTLDLARNPISTVAENEAFLLRVSARDFSVLEQGQLGGVFTAYMDILFNRNLAEPAKFGTSRPTIIDDRAVMFTAGTGAWAGNLDASFGIDEFGALWNFNQPDPQQRPQIFADILIVPKAQGTLVFNTAFAAGQNHEVYTFSNATTSVPASEINFGSTSITIGAANPAPKPTVTINDVSITEGSSSFMTFTVTLSNNNYDVQLYYDTANGTAVTSTDYFGTSGFLTFEAGGSLTRTITVEILDDTTVESTENFFVNLSSALNATISDSQGVGTIIDNDGAMPSVSIGSPAAQAEGNAGTTAFTFPVTLSAAHNQQVTVVYSTANGSATSADNDYAPTSGTLTFAPGETSKNITVNVNGDTKNEANETFVVNLSNAVNANLGSATGTGTITNDDLVPTVTIGNVTQNEGNSGTTSFSFPVTLSAVSGQQVTVVYTTANGTATSPGDYAATSGTLTFAPGETTKNVTVSVVGDTTFETNETFTVGLSNLVNVSAGASITGTGTITNDDLPPVPAISINDVTSAENIATQVFNVTLSHAGTSQITVVYTTSNGTATTADGDYTATSGTLTFAPGETSKSITVAIINDSRNEANETYNVNLSNPTGGATIADGTGAGTITNDDALPSIVIGNVTLAEGNAGTTAFSFPVTLSAVSGQQVTVIYSTSNGTATTADGDYTAVSGTLTFAPGETSKNIVVNVAGDGKNEANETFNVNLSTGVNASIADNLGVGTITNDDAVPALSINSIALPEGNSGTTNFVFTVTLSAVSGQQVTVPFSTSNGSAVAPGDYAAQSGTLTFAAGETSKSITIGVVGDLIDEPATETFTVNLGTPVNASINVGSGTGTIQDDDGPPGLVISDLSLAEGNAGTTNFNFAVTLAAPSAQQITVVYATSNGSATTADGDYTATSGTLTFAPGETSKTATVLVNGDTKNEANETFTVTLSNAVNSDITDGIAVGTITNDDPLPSLVVGDAPSQTEGDSGSKVFTFPVTLSAASGQQVTVVYATSNGTATTADGDYTAVSGTLTFAPGETSKSVTVNVSGDTKNEANETFNLVLSSATNATIADGTGITTITNDDPVPALSIAGVSLTEGNSGTKNFGFVVTLGAVSGQQVTVNFSTANGTATAGSDYTATSGVLTFAPGETSKTINVAVTGDTLSELTETFNVNLSSATNATIGAASAVGEILNDDAPPGLSINDVSLTEGNSGTKNFTFTVSLAEVSGIATTVQFATGGGTATAGTDYVATSGTLTFAPGETSKTVTVVVNGDTVNEANETFNVTLSNASGGTPISIPNGIGTIQNDDIVNVATTGVTANEGNAGATAFTHNVTLSTTSDQTVLVVYSTSNGSASGGTDYTAASGTLTFAPGETTKSITVNVNGDTTFESNETYNLNISSPSAGVVITNSTATGTIQNDDAAPVFAVVDASQTEGTAAGTYTDFSVQITRTGATELSSTVVYSTADGTAMVAPDSASVGRDYLATSGTLTFAPGETSKTITVRVRADRGFEADEHFLVNLSNPTNATIGDGSGQVTIENDDPEGSFDVSTVAGYVFIDTNNNGVKDAAEKPLAGVTITLTPDGNSDTPGVLTYEVVTGADGTYKFEDVETGDYVLTQTQPGFYLDGADHVGTQGATQVHNDSFHVTIDGGADYTGNIFAERGLKPEFISKRLMVASTYGSGQGLLSDVNLSQGAAWISVDGGIDGVLTVQADGNGAGNTTLTLYDSNLKQVATSTGANGDVRVDWTGTPGAPYFIKVSGTNKDVDVRLTNLIDIATGVITVRGTSGDDNFTYDASGSVHKFTINGVTYELNPANISKVIFEGGAGNDRVNIIDSAFNDDLEIGSDWLSLSNDRGLDLTAYGVESLRASASLGNDTADVLAADMALELIGDWA